MLYYRSPRKSLGCHGFPYTGPKMEAIATIVATSCSPGMKDSWSTLDREYVLHMGDLVWRRLWTSLVPRPQPTSFMTSRQNLHNMGTTYKYRVVRVYLPRTAYGSYSINNNVQSCFKKNPSIMHSWWAWTTTICHIYLLYVM